MLEDDGARAPLSVGKVLVPRFGHVMRIDDELAYSRIIVVLEDMLDERSIKEGEERLG